MDQQPRGREKNVTGYGKPIEKRGEGLGTGPVGKSDGYQRRNQQGSPVGGPPSGGTTQRSGGGGKRIGIIGIILALLFGGGFGLNSLMGGDTTPTTPASPATTSSGIFSLFSDSTSSSGWENGSNTKSLNTSVSPAAASKRTVIKGDGSDHATVMVYMCGTDLESKSGMASSDMKEMAQATLNSNVDVIVYTGGCRSWKIRDISNSVNQIYKIQNGQMTCLVRNDGSDPMTKGTTLTRFINYCAKNYPANRNMLILWDHGGGSISGFGYDERNQMAGSLSLKGIGDALKASGQTFDFIGFDACLMGTLESALTLAPYADYLIGSEETEPGVGWYYTNWLTNLARNPATPTLDLGKTIVDDFVGYCKQKCPGQKTTLSVTDLSELTATVPTAFKDFAVETAQTINSKEYKKISDARAKTREFATRNKTDQIDIVDLAYKINTEDSKALADAILGAVKYNDSTVTNAYGLAIYFPYNKTSKVANAVKAYEAMGMDSSYTDCVRSFASLELSGQAVANSQQQSSPFPSLTGNYSGQSPASSIDITSLLGALLGGGTTTQSVPAQSTQSSSDAGSLLSLAGMLLGGQRSFDMDNAVDIISENQLDTSDFVWVKNGDDYQLVLNEEQWKQVHSIQLNVFYDDGEGYIDLGLDNVYRITENGELVSDFDGTWLAIDGQPVPYYYSDTFDDGTNYTITGYVPAMINGTRAELILVFDNANPKGYIAGARYVYVDGETETVAKGVESLTEGDKIEFICDYYSYDGTYQDSYLMGDVVEYNGSNTISNVIIDSDKCTATYLLTDSYNNEYWTPAIPKD